MDAVIEELSRCLESKRSSLAQHARLLVGISGCPASGKSTVAHAIASRVNELIGADVATVVGLDGWHHTRAHLDAMPDPVLAHARRGAHWTFDGQRFVAFVRALHDAPDATCRAPSFDHALKDPVEDDVEVRAGHRIVLLEGLYTFLDVDPWREAGALMDERWFIDVDEDESSRRLVKRHVQTGVTPDAATALQRAVENDLPSQSCSCAGFESHEMHILTDGKFVREHLLTPTRTITSVSDREHAL